VSAIVFTLSEDASARVRAYCNKHGSDLNGMACAAVQCMMDIFDDEEGGPWLPSPDDTATGHDPEGPLRNAPSADVWEMAIREVDAVRTMLDEQEKIARQIRECVAELRAAGMPIRAIAAELARLAARPRNGDAP
jgi:hypothetical protein